MQRARKDSGFALLLVFLLAAIIAINLYMELPRVAVEAQRQKEQLLIARGEEYKRAILVYYKAFNRWPAKIEDLENTNNRHFLRRRFKDPMTGTDDWRLIHIQNGIFTDSITNKPKQQPGQQGDIATAGQYVGQSGGMFDTSSGATGSTGPNLGRRRISDGGTGGGTMVSMDPSNGTGASNGNATAPPSTGSTGSLDNGPVAAPTAPPNPDGSQPGQPGMPPGMPGMPPGMPGMPGIPGAPVNSQTGGVSPYSTTQGANGMPPGFAQPGATAQGANTAQNMIQQILGSPRPGGAPIGTTTAGGGLVIGGGIAGVASKADQEGIMVYNDHKNYKEWEFIFDPSKWRPPANPLAGSPPPGTPASQIGSMPQGQIGTSVNDIVSQQNGTAGASGSTGAT
ncbi:MAG TPA: hypothetical protein VME43_28880, partial [Bryobacteraceae bacterium]|nr:hypothetical protein [Bryobacteraceae bacterium]